jgi:Tfp pilus assembly protein PilX
MPDRQLTEPQLRWEIEQQQLAVEAADAKLRWAERMLTQASTERATAEAHHRADAALLDVEMAEERLRELQQRRAAVTASSPRHHRGPR